MVRQLSLREAWIWSRLIHPNIVPFLGVANYAEICEGALPQLCLITPWMSAGNVTEYLKANKEANRLSLAWDVAKGVKYLHCFGDRPIIHGDLKGSNILVDVEGGWPTACLTDFGLTHVAETLSCNDTTSTSAMGNVRWLAFERLFLSKYNIEHLPLAKTTASDVFELMRTILEILTGEAPFGRYGEVDVMRILDKEQHPARPPSPWIDESMWSTMIQSWSPERSHRPNAGQISDLLLGKLVMRHEILARSILGLYKITLPALEKVKNEMNFIAARAVELGVRCASADETELRTPSVILAWRHGRTLEEDLQLVRHLPLVLSPSRWKHLALIQKTTRELKGWLDFFRSCGQLWGVKTLEVDIARPAEFEVTSFFQAMPALLDFRLRFGHIPRQPVFRQIATPRSIPAYQLRILELDNVRADDVLQLMQLARIRHLVALGLYGNSVTRTKPLKVPKHGAPRPDATVLATKNYIATMSLRELSLHISMFREGGSEDSNVNWLLQQLSGLEYLQLTTSFGLGDFSRIFGMDHSYPRPDLPRLRELEAGGFSSSDVARVVEDRTLHRLSLDARDITIHNYEAATEYVWAGGGYADHVHEIWWFSGPGLRAIHGLRRMEAPLSGTFWNKEELGLVEDIPIPSLGATWRIGPEALRRVAQRCCAETLRESMSHGEYDGIPLRTRETFF